jgi:hypothetical protein
MRATSCWTTIVRAAMDRQMHFVSLLEYHQVLHHGLKRRDVTLLRGSFDDLFRLPVDPLAETDKLQALPSRSCAD